jgi:hypothetical protein
MKELLSHCFHLLLLTTLVSAGELPDDVQRLIDKRGEAIAQIDLKFVKELEKLKTKYTKVGDLDSANAIVALIEKTPVKVVDALPDVREFEGTSWAFHNKAGQLGELELLAGGKIKSQKYPSSSWKLIDKNTLRFQYGDNPDDHVIFRFQDDSRRSMRGNQSVLGTPRYLYKLTK